MREHTITDSYKMLCAAGKGESGTTVERLLWQRLGATGEAGRRQTQNKQKAVSGHCVLQPGPTKSLF